MKKWKEIAKWWKKKKIMLVCVCVCVCDPHIAAIKLTTEKIIVIILRSHPVK